MGASCPQHHIYKGFQWFLVLNGYSKVQSSLCFHWDSDTPIMFCCLYFCGRQMLAKASRQKDLFFLVNTGYFNLMVRKVPKLSHSIPWIFQNFPLSPTVYFKFLGKKQCCREGPRKSHSTTLQKFHLPSLKQFAWVSCQSLDLTCGGIGQTWDKVSGFAWVIRSVKNHIQNGDTILQTPCLCYKLYLYMLYNLCNCIQWQINHYSVMYSFNKYNRATSMFRVLLQQLAIQQ